MSKQRIYHIESRDNSIHLVRATSPAVARSYMARNEFEIRVASQDDIVSAVTDGVIVQEATEGPVQMEMGE